MLHICKLINISTIKKQDALYKNRRTIEKSGHLESVKYTLLFVYFTIRIIYYF